MSPDEMTRRLGFCEVVVLFRGTVTPATCTPPPLAPLARIRCRRRREGWIRRPLPLLHGSRRLSAPLLCGSAVRGDGWVDPATSVVSPPSVRADPPRVMMGGTEVGWQTGRWGDDLDDGDTCGLGAIAIFSPRLDNMSVLLAIRPAREEGSSLRTKVHRGERSRVVVPSARAVVLKISGGAGGGKVGLPVLDGALAFPQATTASQFLSAGDFVHLNEP
ncbi:uncharacterized protein [Oryza sativa Japonica Group]|uniref:uncharacterized protein isoform X2 n=1 Tax=Oryza sativa subsp. japonica TaxID=39947 RepID=UPI0001C7BDD5|nr:uncharacterized protein LOC4344829 isoform X2 [Oryza sativa Japonica Group]KAF2918393.1 hypothetical protein DAI22_08g055500 [Oryza sativa Japonica Group]KAF2918396.1 hypothetical protein DAI22_08g055500 [Oryza sativa Japonica Group]